MKNISSHRGESLDARVGLFMEIQQTLCDNLGLAFAVKHGEPFILYDVFEGRQVEVDPKEVTHVRHVKGETTITREERPAGEEKDPAEGKTGDWFMDRFTKIN